MVGFAELLNTLPDHVIGSPGFRREAIWDTKDMLAVKAIPKEITDELKNQTGQETIQEYKKYLICYSVSDRPELQPRQATLPLVSHGSFLNCLVNSLLSYWVASWWIAGTSSNH